MSVSRPPVAAAFVGLASLVLACGGPLVMIPGGALSGSVEPVPTDWSFTDSVETIQLETRPSDPYSVNVWGTGLGDRLYIACGDPENRWGAYVLADPNVRVRVDRALYELRAELVEDEAEREAFLTAMAKKYDFEPSPEQRGQAILFALSARN